MSLDKESQGELTPAAPAVCASVIPNPKLKLLDQMREVMRVKHFSIRTERPYRDWVRRWRRPRGASG